MTRYYYHANRLYSVAALTDDAGQVVERYQYDGYGLCTTVDAGYDNPMAFSRVGNPFTFTGRELDAETNLMHYRARTYSPVQGRFLQTDPIGFLGGMNLYEYVNSHPINGLDPAGLDELDDGLQQQRRVDDGDRWVRSPLSGRFYHPDSVRIYNDIENFIGGVEAYLADMLNSGCDAAIYGDLSNRDNG